MAKTDRKLVGRLVTACLVLPVALVVGWSSLGAAASLVATATPPLWNIDPPPPDRAANPTPPTPPVVRAAAPSPPAEPPHPIAAWVAVGFGPAGIGGQGGDAARVELALAAGIHLLSLRYLFAADTNGSCDNFICFGNDVSLPHNSVKELALQYGVRKRVPYLLGTASAGVAALWTVQRGDALLSTECFFGCLYQYNSIDGHAVGATAEIGGYLTSRFVSIGPTFVVDINSIQSFWSVIIDLHLGWMGEAPSVGGR